MTYPAQPAEPVSVATASGGRAHGRAPQPWAPRRDLVTGVVLILVLAVLGALLGYLWQWWSPPGPLGFVVAPHAIQPDETEAFIAGDGRFAVLCAAAGLVAGFVVWFIRPTRGPVAVVALGVGGLLGSVLTEGVGGRLAGGTADGKANTILRELPLSVHMRGLLLLEAATAVLVYLLCASFAAENDLGRPEPGEASVGTRHQVQHARRHGDAPRALQQQNLPPQ